MYAISEARQTDPAIAPPLRSSVTWTLAGTILYAACQWAMLITLTKLCSPESVGEFALALAVSAPVLMLVNLQLRSVQTTDTANAYAVGEYFALRLGTTGLAFVLILTVAAWQIHSFRSFAVVAGVGFAKCLEAASDGLYGFLQQKERLDIVAKSYIFRGVICLFLFAAMLFATRSIVWGGVGFALASLVIFCIYDVPRTAAALRGNAERLGLFRDLNFLWSICRRDVSFPRQLRLVWLALPLGVVQMLVSLSANIPRYFLEHYSGSRELGIFATLAYFIVVGQTLVNALGQASFARMARFYSERELGSFVRMLAGMAGAGILLGGLATAIAALFGRILLSVLYGAPYAAHADALVLTMAGAGVAYVAWFLGFGMTAVREFRLQVPLLALSSAATYLASWRLVPSQGVKGAALAMTIGFVVLAIGSLAIVLRALFQARVARAVSVG
jgi:O-antigen/teichoic acid export membrane protein